MERWETRARKEVSSAYGTSSLVIRDSLAKHLEQLVTALASAGKISTSEIATATTEMPNIGEVHGRYRANTSLYSIAEVIFEYRILRQVVIQTLEESIPLSGTEREIITDLTEQAVNDAAREFSEVMNELREQHNDTLTHDLRGPITTVKTSAQLITRRPDHPDLCLKSAVRIIDSANRLDSMIQDLLDAGRIRAGQPLSIIPEECDPTEIARELIDELATTHGERFALDTDPDLRTWWSPTLFRRAIENLLINAVKYGAPQAPISLTIEANDASVRVAVHNEGSAIPEDERSTLFQKYRRLKSDDNSAKQGWGLGLTLVSGVAQAHGGTVHVDSSEGKGTSFVMVIPKDCRKVKHAAA